MPRWIYGNCAGESVRHRPFGVVCRRIGGRHPPAVAPRCSTDVAVGPSPDFGIRRLCEEPVGARARRRLLTSRHGAVPIAPRSRTPENMALETSGSVSVSSGRGRASCRRRSVPLPSCAPVGVATRRGTRPSDPYLHRPDPRSRTPFGGARAPAGSACLNPNPALRLRTARHPSTAARATPTRTCSP